jgi:hypothetical protein
MQSVPHLLIVAVVFGLALGVPIGVYVLLTRGQRRTTREIRVAAAERGWKYRRRRWQGDPTSFRINGSLADGQTWIMTSQGTSGSDRGWTVRLGLRFPMLGGEEDFAVEPRKTGLHGSASLGPPVTAGVERRVAVFGEVFARKIGFYREAKELLSGVRNFDAAYQILALLDRIHQSPVDTTLAERILRWPADALQPHSMRSWRDAYGLHIEARLPGPPNWATVSYLVALGEDLIARVPPPAPSPPARTLIDRTFDRFMRS